MEGILRFRHNAMSITAISGFENIKGGIHDRCKDVYFVRALGVGAAYGKEIRELDDTLTGMMDSGRGYYCRLDALPKLQDMEDTAFYTECYVKWAEGGRNRAATRFTKDNGVLEDMLGHACAAVEEVCMRGQAQMTESMRKNMMVKMLFWYDSVFDGKGFAWDEKKMCKVVAANIDKRQEYLFFYLLTLMGCDVLLLQGGKDIGEAEERLGLSVKFVLGKFAETTIPEYVRERRTGNPSGEMEDRRVVPVSGQGGQDMIQMRIPPRERRVPSDVQVNREKTAAVREQAVPAEAEKSFEELARMASSVVMIAIHDNKGDVIGTGSGIMVGRDGYILTNNHVASGGKYYSVRIEDDDKVYTTDEVIKYNYVLDLAVIRIDRRLAPIPVYRGAKKLVRGQKVVAIGSPLGLFNSVSDGIISGFRIIDGVDMIQFTAPTSHGSSGGAVLNMQGEVIGISTAGFEAGQNINLAVGYECINTFIMGFT